MKKIYFSLLMISAMFMVASCGSKSNQEQEEVKEKEVTFTDPAITYVDGIDVTSYFSAESVTKPGIWRDHSGQCHLSTNVKLKVLKKLNVVNEKEGYSNISFYIKFCDENGSTIEKGARSFSNFENWSEGTVITLDVKSDGHDGFESTMKERLDKVAKIEVSIKSFNLKFAETAESNE